MTTRHTTNSNRTAPGTQAAADAMKAMLLLAPRQPGVPAAGGALDLLVRVQAPDLPAGTSVKSLPKRLALVIDRSGSMNGRPLKEALRCVEHIIDHLSTQDSVAVVTYDSEIEVLWPLTPVQAEPVELRARLARVRSGGNTDLHGGWQQGARLLADAALGSGLSRVILLSDGQANHGVTDEDDIARESARWLAQGVSTTTVGLGHGFNEQLMMQMAQAGGGRQYYGQTAEDLHDSFDEELALLKAMYWRDLRLKLMPAPRVVIEPLGNVTQEADGRYRLADLAWGSEAWMALRLHLSPSASGTLRDLLAARVEAIDVDGHTVSVTAPLLQLPAVDAQALTSMTTDETVARRHDEVAFAQASRGLRELAERGDLRALQTGLAELERRFGHHPWLQDKLRVLRDLAEHDVEMFGKEVSYSAWRISARLAPKEELMFAMDETREDIPAFLRRKSVEGRGRRR